MKRIIIAFAVLTVVASLGAALAVANSPAEPLPDGVQVDRVVLEKAARELYLYSGRDLVRTYSVSLGAEPIGHKRQEGDECTPEGEYVLDYRNEKSAFHRSIHISYPSQVDVLRARATGVDPGGSIMIHGLPNKLGWIGELHLVADWTDGCIAVTNPEIEEIWKIVRDGTPISIVP